MASDRKKRYAATPMEERPGYKRGGYTAKRDGRKYVYQGDRKYIPVYRKIAEIALGRQLKRHEVVHHINGNPTDNRNCNLLICEQTYHKWLHERMSKFYMAEHFSVPIGV